MYLVQQAAGLCFPLSLPSVVPTVRVWRGLLDVASSRLVGIFQFNLAKAMCFVMRLALDSVDCHRVVPDSGGGDSEATCRLRLVRVVNHLEYRHALGVVLSLRIVLQLNPMEPNGNRFALELLACFDWVLERD